MQGNVCTSMNSVILEPTKLTLVGTRTTYQATGDAGAGGYLFVIVVKFCALVELLPNM